MNNVTDDEIELYYVVKGTGGNFMTKLFELICAADDNNQRKLSLGYEGFVNAVQRYQKESGYWEDLQKRMKEV